jgi:hypothetical protein
MTSTTPKAAPQLAEGRELVIVDRGHATRMPPSVLEDEAAAPVDMTRDSVSIY